MATTPTFTTRHQLSTAGAGFTLLELLVVLAIIGVVVAISAPQLNLPGVLEPTRKAARDLTAALAQTRAEAVRANREATFTLDVTGRRYRVNGGPEKALSANLTLTLHTARSKLADVERGTISFFPDGTSSGGWITLAGANPDRRITIQISWLTGRIAIEP